MRRRNAIHKSKPLDKVAEIIKSDAKPDLHDRQIGLTEQNIGLKAAKLLCENFANIDDLMNAKTEDISSIEGFGLIMFVKLSRFWKNKISALTSVPAFALKAVFGSRIAPNKSARSAKYFRTSGDALSIVPFVGKRNWNTK